MTTEQTPLRRFAVIAAPGLLGQPLDDWVHERRARGVPWRAISRELLLASDGQLDVTHEWLRKHTAATEQDRRAS
jgi:hypothetical protein